MPFLVSERLIPVKESAALLLPHTGEALAAINRTVGLGLEGNLRLAAASSAGSGKILAGTAGCGLAGIPAGLAALRLILEAALRIELLLASGEHELLAAFLAYKCLVFVHDLFPLFDSFAQARNKPTVLGL